MKDLEVAAIKAKHRRDRLRAAGLCISGAAHGEATHGVLCLKCRIVHRGSNRYTSVLIKESA